MSQTSGGDKWWRCTNSACNHPPTIPLSAGIAFKVCPFCTTTQPSQEATSQTNKPKQEVAESLQRPPLHPEADLVERASNLEFSTPNVSETRTQGSLQNASQTLPTSRNVPQVQFSPEGNVTSAESHSSQQKPSNDPPSAPREKPTPGNNGPPRETPKPDSGSPGENPTPGSPKENPTPGPPRENPTSGPSRENPTPSPPGETPKQENTPDNNDPSGTIGKNYIPGTTDNPAPQPNHEASGAENKDSHPTGNPKVSCFYVVFCSV